MFAREDGERVIWVVLKMIINELGQSERLKRSIRDSSDRICYAGYAGVEL